MATPYRYIWNWRWRVRKIGSPDIAPNLYIQDAVRDVIYDKLLNVANEHNVEVSIESVGVTTYGWNRKWVKGDEALWELESMTTTLFSSDNPNLEDTNPIGVLTLIGIVLVGAVASLIGYWVCQIIDTLTNDLQRRGIEEEFPCPYGDGLVFYSIEEREQHIDREHPQEDPYICKYKTDGSSFKTQAELQEHYRVVHGETGTGIDLVTILLLLGGVLIAIVLIIALVGRKGGSKTE